MFSRTWTNIPLTARTRCVAPFGRTETRRSILWSDARAAYPLTMLRTQSTTSKRSFTCRALVLSGSSTLRRF